LVRRTTYFWNSKNTNLNSIVTSL